MLYEVITPCLTDVAYPDVLVARAYSGGDDLDLVLYDGIAPGPPPVISTCCIKC